MTVWVMTLQDWPLDLPICARLDRPGEVEVYIREPYEGLARWFQSWPLNTDGNGLLRRLRRVQTALDGWPWARILTLWCLNPVTFREVILARGYADV